MSEFNDLEPQDQFSDSIVVVPDTETSGLSITASAPFIPSASRVSHDKILTQSSLTLKLTRDGQPVSGVTLALQSSRGTDGTINGSSVSTNQMGVATAKIQTRKQPGTSTVSSANSGVETVSPVQIQWLPARFQHSFLVTCYITSLESNFLNTPLIDHVAGLPPKERYHSGFIHDTREQGSGRTLGGTIIGYSNGRYRIEDCPHTSTVACATDGTTIAVDKHVVPYRSTVLIDGDGDRIAQDSGGAIVGYHIDEYFGVRRNACKIAGHRQRDVTYESY